METTYWAIVGVARSVFLFQGLKFRMRGEMNVPRKGGAVMAINHTAYVDFLYAGLGARKQHRWLRFMAKKSIWEHPVAGAIFRSVRHIPVDRSAGAGALNAAIDALKSGEIVAIYPEATLSRSFELKEFKTGAVRMAQEAGVPILPTVVWGAQRVWTKDNPRNFGRSKIPIFVSIGEPLHIGPDDDVVARTQELKEIMQALLDEQQANYPQVSGSDLNFIPRRLGGTAPTPEEALVKDTADMQRTEDQFTRKKK